MRIIRRINFVALIFGLFLSLFSCKTLLAPEYDKAIVEAITITSEKTMSLFAEVAEGTSKSNFAEREEAYNRLIGAYDALSIKAKARPIPDNVATKKINQLLGQKGSNPISGNYPSAFAFEKISETLMKMKQTDKQKDIESIAIEAFKGQIEIFLDQAITYESFLKR